MSQREKIILTEETTSRRYKNASNLKFLGRHKINSSLGPIKSEIYFAVAASIYYLDREKKTSTE